MSQDRTPRFPHDGENSKQRDFAAATVRLQEGLAYHQRGQLERAERVYREVLAHVPEHFDALHLLGMLEGQKGNAAGAIEWIAQAIRINPNDASAHSNIGVAQLELRRPQEALTSFDRALAIEPKHLFALNNRGIALQNLGRCEEAVASYDRVLSIKSDDPEAHYNRGNALWRLKRHEEALAGYDHALALRPHYPKAIFSRGNLLRGINRHEDALACFARLQEIAPDFDYALGDLQYAKLICCDWAQHEEAVARIEGNMRASKRAATPFPFLSLSHSAAEQLLCSRMLVADKFPAASQPVWRGERYRHDRIRLAYLSADFRVHPSSLLLAGMFELHDRGRFETIAISFGDDDRSEMRSRLKQAFERFLDVRDRNDLEVAHLMRELEVDIAVDLMGHTQDTRLGILACRPAPIQVNFFCPGTSGADYLDYIVCDRIVIPEDHHGHYSEKVVYLPDTFQANDSGRRIAERTPTRAEAGLPDDGIVFCSFSQSYKISPAMFDIWMRLLRNVAGSVLWLQQVNEAAARNLRREAAQRGIDASRLIFAPRVPELEVHLARYRLADLFLDTLPYNAQTTASDALWAGLPVLTCLGTTFVGRVAASLLNAIGLPELITHSLQEYEALAFKLATQRETLADIKARLARNRATYPLFDTDRFRRHIESAYVTIWERHQRGAQPASLSVQPLP